MFKQISLLIGFGMIASVMRAEITVNETDGVVRVEINGARFADYNYRDVARPYLYPIFGPTGMPMTRDWPMAKNPDDTQDHVHHKGLWYAHGDINGLNFWSEQKSFGKTRHKKFTMLKSGKNEGVISSLNDWVAPSGTVICTDERLLRFRADGAMRSIDYEITLNASHGDLLIGDTKEGSMSIRVPSTMTVSGKDGKGHIVTSEGLRDEEAWGQAAAWVDYWAPVQDKTVGIAIFDHPSNPRHPTRWHVRTYGLFAANPFGLHHFDKQAGVSGDLKISSGGHVTFRYRFVFHAGDDQQAGIATLYKAYCDSQSGATAQRPQSSKAP